MVSDIFSVVFNITLSSLLFGLLAASFSLIYSVTKISHLAHGAIVLASGYFLFWLLKIGTPLWLTIILNLIFATLLGLFSNIFVYEKLREKQKISSASSLIASIALLILIQAIILFLFKSRTKIVSLPIVNISPLEFYGITFTFWHLIIIVSSIFFLLVLFLIVKKTKLGLTLRALADNPEMAEIIGINGRKIRNLTFAIGSFLAGVTGILAAVEFNLDPNMGVSYAIAAFGRAVVGGIGSIEGALLGSFLLETSEHLTAWFWTATYKQVISLLIVFIFLIWRPQGILGSKTG